MDHIINIYVYNFSFVSQMGSELRIGGRNWHEMVRVNSIQRVRPSQCSNLACAPCAFWYLKLANCWLLYPNFCWVSRMLQSSRSFSFPPIDFPLPHNSSSFHLIEWRFSGLLALVSPLKTFHFIYSPSKTKQGRVDCPFKDPIPSLSTTYMVF